MSSINRGSGAGLWVSWTYIWSLVREPVPLALQEVEGIVYSLDWNFQKLNTRKAAWWEFACLVCNLIQLGNRGLPLTEFCLYQFTIMSSLNISLGIILAPVDGGGWVFNRPCTTSTSHFWCWVSAILTQKHWHSIPITMHCYWRSETQGAENCLLLVILIFLEE